MTIQVDVTPDIESGLRAQAEVRGISVHEYVADLVRQAAAAAGLDPTLALFSQWAREDATDDPRELAQRQREWDELEASLKANRTMLQAGGT